MRILFCITAVSFCCGAAVAGPRQLTFSCENHELDNNDNFSPDGRFLCYDTRETAGPGIDNGQAIEIVEIATGREIVLYRPPESIIGAKAAPGVGAVSFSGAAPEAAFIHGPPVSEVKTRGYYGKPNRCGARVRIDGDIVEKDGEFRMLKDGEFTMSWIDRRDIETGRDTLPGAHRGGTHRHEYTRDGKRIGFTYDDFLMPEYDRTVGYMEASPKAPEGATHYFAILVPVVPRKEAKPGALVKAAGDAWVDAHGRMRAFIGTIMKENGEEEDSLFVADIPDSVDITTADSGGPDRFPSPPEGIRIRRLTRDHAGGIVRGAPDGKRIAYYGKDAKGDTQLFIIDTGGSNRVQASHIPGGVTEGLRWHPSGDFLFCIADDGLAAIDIREGEGFGKHRFLTPHGDGIRRYAPVVSPPDGSLIAYNRPVETEGRDGTRCVNYMGDDFSQIFLVDFDAAGKQGE